MTNPYSSSTTTSNATTTINATACSTANTSHSMSAVANFGNSSANVGSLYSSSSRKI
eukprot:CAMPEP_0175075896 /NCGR_PEP_ID=MMETSP0052_2-20121109/22352_1 /TAXON_ID=51329 ORGANISM="Polytomella parva, Strain SAG 63-3" /NCGR_SAMPLE_ID=MMETSP0052_2 /ASSEMBLY_ACC=CAM_ASM_000194 /LENGTH=56 /DNA_ID=CAMNT_0016344827 /DNA_START=105 /DNA_END=272 /DNA_ORIENTATION=+